MGWCGWGCARRCGGTPAGRTGASHHRTRWPESSSACATSAARCRRCPSPCAGTGEAVAVVVTTLVWLQSRHSPYPVQLVQDVWVRAQSTVYGSRTVRADTIVQGKWERQSPQYKRSSSKAATRSTTGCAPTNRAPSRSPRRTTPRRPTDCCPPRPRPQPSRAVTSRSFTAPDRSGAARRCTAPVRTPPPLTVGGPTHPLRGAGQDAPPTHPSHRRSRPERGAAVPRGRSAARP